MSTSPQKINYKNLLSIIVGLTTILGTIATIVTIPDIGCKVGWNSESCVVQRQEIDLITQSETGESLAGVKIQFIAKGAPEVQFTDSNGYAKVKVPNEGDVRINLSKTGYPAQDFIINLKNTQSTTRTIRFSSSGKPEVQEFLPTPTPTPTSTSTLTPTPTSTPTLAPTPSSTPTSTPKPPNKISEKDFLFVLKGCYKSGQNIDCQLIITNQGDDRRQLDLYANYISLGTIQSIIFANNSRYVASKAKLADRTDSGYVNLTMPYNIGIEATVSFPGVPKEINKLEAVEFWINVNGGFPLKFSEVSVSTR